MLWSEYPKTVFYGKGRELLSVGQTVGTLNEGAGFKRNLLGVAGITDVGMNTLRMVKREVEVRRKCTAQNISKKYKVSRIRKKVSKEKEVEEAINDYEAGGFDHKGRSSKNIASSSHLESKIKEVKRQCKSKEEPVLNEGNVDIARWLNHKMVKFVHFHPKSIEK